MLKNLLINIFAILSVCLVANAQDLQITGRVVDSSKEGMPGVTVLIEGTTQGTSTDIDGSFSFKSAPKGANLVISFLGYETQKMPIDGRASYEIVLKEEVQSIGEVIVMAFGTAKKEAFTGSATVLKADDIAKTQQTNVAQALSGKVAGVQLSNSSGQPGASPEIRIRGFSSLNAGNSPLWVVDGMPYSGDLGNLNPADIESMTVLKDAASNALYGARGANGVVMITTKKARSRDAVISVDAKWGVNARATKDYEYIKDPAMYYETHYNSLKNYYMSMGSSAVEAHHKANRVVAGSSSDGGLDYMVFTVPAGESFIGLNGKINPNATLGRKVMYGGESYWLQPDDWTDAAYRESVRQEYNVSVAKSTEDFNIYASFGYLNNEGIAYNSDMDRYTARLKVDTQAKKWLKIGANVTYTHFNYNQIDDSGAGNSSGNVFAFTSMIAPIYPLYIRDGEKNIRVNDKGLLLYDYGNGANAGLQRSIFPNSNALSDSRLNKQSAEGNAFNGTGFFDISFLKDFKFTFNAGVTLDETRTTSLVNPFFGQFASEKGIVSKGHSRRLEFNTQQILNYTKQIARHNVNVMVGHEYYNAKNYGLSASKSNIFTPGNTELSGAIIDKQSASSGRTEYNNEGYFTRVMYDFDSKYFASASYRRDASSRFHPKHLWGNFWSLGGAWIITREAFMDNARSWLDNLKFKASIGSQGNDNIGDFRYIDNFTIENSNGQISNVFYSKGSSKITWETNTNFNAGLEFSMFQGRIAGGVEYFLRKTTDMLLSFPVPPSMGYTSYYANVGDMANKGIEIELNFTPIQKKNFMWNISLNMTHMRNKITMLPEERRTKEVEGYRGYVSGNTFFAEDLPMYTFYMRKYAGVSGDGRSMWYRNVIGADGKPTGEVETTTDYSSASDYICGNPIPDLYGGFSTSFSFFGFDLGFDFNYQIGGKAYDSGYAAARSEERRVGKECRSRWSPYH